MPEQKHYPNTILNYGYVYTNLSKDLITIVQEDMDYIVQYVAKRIDNYQSVALSSYFINTRLNRNRLGSKFRRCLYEAAEQFFGITLDATKTNSLGLYHYNVQRMAEKFIEMNIEQIEIPIPKDLELNTEIGVTYVEQKERFAKTTNELNILFRQFCRANVGDYAKVDSTPVLEMALKMLFE
jgi:type III restriction enzyme